MLYVNYYLVSGVILGMKSSNLCAMFINIKKESQRLFLEAFIYTGFDAEPPKKKLPMRAVRDVLPVNPKGLAYFKTPEGRHSNAARKCLALCGLPPPRVIDSSGCGSIPQRPTAYLSASLSWFLKRPK